MGVLHNRVSQVLLKQKVKDETFVRFTISFYKYFPFDSPGTVRDELYNALFPLDVLGRIYLASEGINAQVSVPEHQFGNFKNALNVFEGLSNLRFNKAVEDNGKSFWVLKIKVRNKIVADGITDPDFSMNTKGKYVDAETFNKLAEQPDTVVVDMRNHYEFEVGHFEHAIEIPSDTFRAQLPMAAGLLAGKENKNIIMYCTGGIRCEKASAYMLHRGFKNVFHLEGGILNYANEVKQKALPNKFKGKNFVFDDRLGERVTDEIIASCHQCGKPADTHTNCKNEGCHLLFIQCEDCATLFNGCCSTTCFEVVALPLEIQKQMRKGQEKGKMIFNKSQQRLRPPINK